ncbi:MAG: hypothetical protein ACYDCA_01440 [Candidatus Tyrphobacter sp.]
MRPEKSPKRVACLLRRMHCHVRIITTSIQKSIVSYERKNDAIPRQQMLSDDLIAKIGNGLDAMPPKPASRRELDLLLTNIEAKIRAAQERGATYADIAKQISESGYPIKTSTLRVALQRRKKEPGVKRTARRSTTKGAPTSTLAAKTPAPSVTPAAAAPQPLPKKPEHA